MEHAIVVVVIALAAVYVAKTYIKKGKASDRCGCGCTGCDTVDSCSEIDAGKGNRK